MKKKFSHSDLTSDIEGHSTKKWFEEYVSDPKKFELGSDELVNELKDEAKKCYDAEVANHNIKSEKSNSNYKWLKTLTSKGTVSDKIAACTILIQDNPIYSLDILKHLINMVKVGKKKECIQVMDTLSELFLSDLLKPNEKLKNFQQRPLVLLNDLSSGNAIKRRKILTVWYFENQLKELYANFVASLNNVAHDTLDQNKQKAVSAMFKLLVGNPEQEKALLSHLVNKLGDPSQKVASKAIYCLTQLLFKHPNMQEVVSNEVEKLLFRSNVSTKTQYYSLCFLSQFYLSHETVEVSRKLIEVYFSFFKACIKKGEIDSRMMSALLMGVNRAFPYAKLEISKISEHIDTLYRVIHIANFNISLHALCLLHQVSANEHGISDRFHSALYKKLIDPKLFTSTHQAILLNLIYKTILGDKEIMRVKAFLKRLLQLSCFMQPPSACGVLFLISQILGKKEGVQSLILKQSAVSNLNEENEEDEKNIITDKDVVNNWDHSVNSTRKNNFFYNPFSRNPLYAGGDFCAYTELLYLKNHYHPTVSLYASNILDGKSITYVGDPLKDFTLIRFLDRFVYKNPKKSENVSQGVHPTFGKRKMYNPNGIRALSVKSANYLNEDSEKIPVDELFMFNYLQKINKKKETQLETDEDSDLESVQSEEFEELLDQIAGVPKEDSLDFLTEITDSKKTAKCKSKKIDDQDEDELSENEEFDFIEDEADLSGDEVDDENFTDSDIDDDLKMKEDDKELLKDLDSDDEDEVLFDEANERKKTNSNKKSSNKMHSIFVSAEKFASLLEDEGSLKVAPGGSTIFENKDNASNKQLAWEEKRNRWLRGFNKTARENSKSRGFVKKRKNKNSFGNKHKKNKC